MRRHTPLDRGFRYSPSGRIRKRYVVLLVLLLLIGWVGWKVIGAVTARPGPHVDYAQQLLDMNRSMQPEGANGWPALLQALDRLAETGFPERDDWPTDRQQVEDIRYLHRVLEGEYDANRLEFELAYVEHIADSGVLELLDEFAASPRAMREEFNTDGSNSLLFVLLPELGQARGLARTRAAAMRIAAERDDPAELIRAWEHLVRLSYAMSYDPVFISHLVGISIANLACTEMNRIIAEYDLDEETCLALLAALDRAPVLAPIGSVMERERLSQYDIIQHTHSDDGHGDGILLVGQMQELAALSGPPGMPLGGEHPIYNIAGLVLPGRAETTRLVDFYFDEVVRQAGLPRNQRAQQPINLDQFIESLPRVQILLRLTLPAIGRAVSAHDTGMAIIEATRILLAIEAFEARHGRLPAALNELAPEFLDTIPEDPVACQPFVYVVRQPTADDPRAYWLYSVGLDAVDNQGAEPESQYSGGHALHESRDYEGLDHIYNRLRDPYSDEDEERWGDGTPFAKPPGERADESAQDPGEATDPEEGSDGSAAEEP